MVQKLLQSWLQRSLELWILTIFLHVIFLNSFCQKVLAQSEISRSFFSPFNTDDNWNTYLAENSNHITNCVTSDIFGGRFVFNSQTVITKTFILPPHYKLKIELNFWRLDPWNSFFYIVFVNGEKAISNNPNSSGTEICGSGSLGQVDTISKQMDHIGNSAVIIIVSRQASAYWGISDFKLSILNCPYLCDYCNSVGVCQIWYRVLTYFTTPTFTNGQGWLKDNAQYDSVLDCGFQYYGNFLTTQLASVNLILNDPHTRIKVAFIFLSVEITSSVTIEVNGDTQMYYFTTSLNTVANYDYLCGSDLKMTRIETLGPSSTSSTMTITIGVPTYLTTSLNTPYFGIRDFEVFTYQENKIIDYTLIHKNDYILTFEGFFSQQYNCVVGCSNCIRDLCIECFSGWNFDANSLECLPICGDQLILNYEECDDGNLYPNDGCYQCKFSCPLNCVQCEFGQCKICYHNYKLIDNYCQLSCLYEDEDSLIKYDIQIKEGHYCQIANFLTNAYLQHFIINTNLQFGDQDPQCQLQNYGIFAYQYNQCEYKEPPNCIISIFNDCELCMNQFERTFDGQCIPICSQGIYYRDEFPYNSFEFQFDSTFQSSRCQLECLECHNSFCFSCLQGWNLVDYRCDYQCGDGIIAMNSNEQCDDQNQDGGDGCYECKFECQQNCVFCNVHHECVICNEYFEIKDKNCIPICGDGFVVEGQEICDDGNDIQYDGCHNCENSCREHCQICDYQNCLDISDQADINPDSDNEIISICGDSIVTSFEQCDDGNDDPFDGCDLCLYSCPLNCKNCLQNLCEDCNRGFVKNGNDCQTLVEMGLNRIKKIVMMVITYLQMDAQICVIQKCIGHALRMISERVLVFKIYLLILNQYSQIKLIMSNMSNYNLLIKLNYQIHHKIQLKILKLNLLISILLIIISAMYQLMNLTIIASMRLFINYELKSQNNKQKILFYKFNQILYWLIKIIFKLIMIFLRFVSKTLLYQQLHKRRFPITLVLIIWLYLYSLEYQVLLF
ncbi:unnamed protein product [Paramecium octaurelia]|uniref:Uncharacterized protein n=1 Tax=Paramecium octaurelia TaxID=43137 RepID=A0A8S1XCF6_PAROT|nr:unnamed protein product [Paramecium octaurelia]